MDEIKDSEIINLLGQHDVFIIFSVIIGLVIAVTIFEEAINFLVVLIKSVVDSIVNRSPVNHNEDFESSLDDKKILESNLFEKMFETDLFRRFSKK
ncbi:hypothetical protein [Lysinibacillus xylanilyticus]|uniref:Uncharacterized protein n=1 Tax=Lysinibacillus xylanilyticus TaxID=582475 RepID=A0A2M9PXR4_9BACI|nr:hypothetical protein [Lysinibacillus xylanilyticus]PJO40623.1 hypothetical protein CWD94_27130 [Lysinibacillus xylanilyticus]